MVLELSERNGVNVAHHNELGRDKMYHDIPPARKTRDPVEYSQMGVRRSRCIVSVDKIHLRQDRGIQIEKNEKKMRIISRNNEIKQPTSSTDIESVRYDS